MSKSRLEAFSDGVLAILITIMVLELKVPHGTNFGALKPLWPVFASYVLSFVYVGIYWNNHHHLFQIAKRVNGRVLWANLHLLFWLSLIPFVTGWAGENGFAPLPVALYGVVLLGAGLAYFLLDKTLLRLHGDGTPLQKALQNTSKEQISMLGYAAAIPLAFVNRWISCTIYVAIALVWLVPDTRIERHLENNE